MIRKPLTKASKWGCFHTYKIWHSFCKTTGLLYHFHLYFRIGWMKSLMIWRWLCPIFTSAETGWDRWGTEPGRTEWPYSTVWPRPGISYRASRFLLLLRWDIPHVHGWTVPWQNEYTVLYCTNILQHLSDSYIWQKPRVTLLVWVAF